MKEEGKKGGMKEAERRRKEKRELRTSEIERAPWVLIYTEFSPREGRKGNCL